MAESSFTASASHAAHTTTLSLASADEQYTKMAQAVATLLSPTITAAVDRAVTARIAPIRDHNERASRQVLERLIIVRYLNYLDRFAILKSIRNANSFQLEGHKLLIFINYLQEIYRKWKAFQPMCSALHRKGVKFTLVYPAILRLTDQAGETKFFLHPDEAGSYLQAHLHIPWELYPIETSRYPEVPREQCSPDKYPPKRVCYSNNQGSPKR